MALPTSKLSRVLAFAAGPIAVVAAGAMVLQGSYAAFEAETRVANNSWTTGHVELTNDSGATAAFSVTNMVPGSTGSKCIVVTSTASVAGTVKLYFINPSPTPTTGNVEDYVDLKIEEGTGGSFSDCTGFTLATTLADDTLYNLAVDHGSWTNALGAWSVTSGSRTYKFTWDMQLTAPQVQGQHFGMDFEWEMQNNLP